MAKHRFNVFGRIYAIERVGESWRTFAVGSDGKLGPGGFVVPDEITGEELEQFLFDLFHEDATPGNGDIHRIA